jgi:hypothetical protein
LNHFSWLRDKKEMRLKTLYKKNGTPRMSHVERNRNIRFFTNRFFDKLRMTSNLDFFTISLCITLVKY